MEQVLSFLKNWYRFISPKFQTVHLDYSVVNNPRFTAKTGPHPELDKILKSNDAQYRNLINKMLNLVDRFSSWSLYDEVAPSLLPQWNNDFLPALDMVALYTIITEYKPKHIIEIGSGNSTKVIRAAIEDHNIQAKITSIDPAPRADVDRISDTVIREGFEFIELNPLIKELQSGDILFIDNSHRILPNSDATVVFTELMHRLKQGVIVHIHDIYIPFDYPKFMCDRFYSEQYGLMIAILANPSRYKPLFPAYYISQDPLLQTKLNPIWDISDLINSEKHGGSFWIEISS